MMLFSSLSRSGVALPKEAKICSRRSMQTLSSTRQSASVKTDGEDRRQILMAMAGISASTWLSSGLLAHADEAPDAAIEVPYKLFRGMASPPTSYGGYGGNANESPKYTFEYPPGWKTETPSKVEKGTQGIDGRVVSPKTKGEKNQEGAQEDEELRAFVITLGRAGEDGKTFILRDTESTFAGFAGADYNLQDALSSATKIDKSERTVDGVDFFDFDIDSPGFHYLASIAVKSGKVFALFVRSPARLFKDNEPDLRRMLDTFRLL